MDLRRFITFKTVVEEGSFLRAAQKLCCTQSTVTFHIQQLEQELAIPLFYKIVLACSCSSCWKEGPAACLRPD